MSSSWMMMVGVLFTGLAVAGCASHNTGPSFGPGSLAANDPRCEYRKEPLGIGETHPRFSWTLAQHEPLMRNLSQSAYRIMVSSTKDGKGDLWDTGKISSDTTAQIPYEGKPLVSNQDCYWTVKVWDADGGESGWSIPQRFTMGLLHPTDWTAQWVGYDAPYQNEENDPATDLSAGHWVWLDEPGDATKDAPNETVQFRKVVEIPSDRSIKRALLAVTADNNARVFINGQVGLSGTDFHKIYVQNANWMLKPGPNVIAVEAINSGGPAGLTGKLTIEYETGEPQNIWVDASWKSSKAPSDKPKNADAWKHAEFDDSTWHDSKVIAKVGDAPWGELKFSPLTLPPVPYLRSEFAVTKPVKRATAYATALGLYQLNLNGAKVGAYELTPGWEDYRHRVYYNTYDITTQIKQGKNALGVLLGDGWYDGYVGYTGKRHTYQGEPRARIQLLLEFADGTTQTVSSDQTWRATYGPVREADLLMGCSYDASLESMTSGFDKPGFDDSKWQPVVTGAVGPFANVPVQAYCGDPTIRDQSLPAKKISQPSSDAYVFDLGQNMVGWARFKLHGKAGQKITIRYAEMLNPDGTLYTTALRSARATDSYTPAKTGSFEFEPLFTFHGFRYVEVAGLDSKPDLSAVTGVVVHADMPRTGSFECSNPLVNQLFHNIIWGQKGNYLEVPTDCPQRDERLGWTGDAQFFVRTGSYNFDVSSFFNKWLIDLVQDSQMDNGGFSHVAPAIVLGDGGATAWQDASVICTYTMYKFYGDTTNIRRHWDHLTRFMVYLHDTSKDYIRNDKPFGDWLNQGASSKSEVTGTAYYAYVSRLMSEMAAAIGKQDESRNYAELSDHITAKFQKEFVKPDGSILDSSQTAFALAFTMNLLPPNLREKAAAQFVEEVKKKDWHLGTGFIGTPRLLPGLQAAGQTDVAYKLLLQDTFPSWLFQVKLGATTMWERWDGFRPEKGFQDPGMNSFNHYAFGSVGEWLYESVAGIDQRTSSFKNIVIHPHPGGDFSYAKGTYNSIHGPIISDWKIAKNTFTLHVQIPPNTTAEIYVPGTGAVMEGAKPVAESTGVRYLRQDDNCNVYAVGSGSYTFTASNP